MATSLDLAATVLDLAGLEARTRGVSLKPLLRGQPPPRWRTELYLESFYDIDRGPERQSAGLRVKDGTGDWKYIEHYDGRRELYDLKNDPDEKRNLYRDPAYRETRTQLQQRLNERMKEITDPLITDAGSRQSR